MHLSARPAPALPEPHRKARALLRITCSGVLLAVVLWWLDPAQAFGKFSAAWLLPALGLGLPQVWLSAWRWRLTATRLGLRLTLSRAFREYYLAGFLNQIVPGGVAGDLARAWRHAGDAEGGRAAWHAVLIERASGQFALALLALLALACSPPLRDGLADGLARLAPGTALALAAALLLGLVALRPARHALAALGRDFSRAMFDRRVLALQLLGSLAVVASYVAVYFCCARAIGIARPAAELLPLIPPVLLAMALPLSLAGWGLREGAAALVWLVAGLPAAEGVAISVAYGAVIFCASLPGALILLLDRTGKAALRGPAEARSAGNGKAP